MKRNIWWDGSLVTFHEFRDRAQTLVGDDDVCPLCKQLLADRPTISVVLIVSRSAGVPNRFVHSRCLEDKTDEYAFRLIAEDYKEAQKYADWFW